MAWTVELGGASGFIVAEDDDASFLIDQTWTYDANDSPQEIMTIIQIDGDVVKATASGVATRVQAWFDVAALQARPLDVKIKLDGKARWHFSPALATSGPRITRFATTSDTDGTGEQHWRVTLGIEIKQTVKQVQEGSGDPPDDPTGGGGGDPVEDEPLGYKGEIINVKRHDGVVVKKVWRFYCKSKTLAAAVTLALGFKPTGVKVQEELQRDSSENSAVATWVWEHERGGGVIQIIEDPVQINGGGADFVAGLRIKTDGTASDPVLHQARNKAATVIIRGRVISYSSVITAPQAHFTPSTNVKRWSARESIYDVSVEDKAKGTFSLRFEEVYIVKNVTSLGAPQHVSHNDLVVISQPEDGTVLTFQT